MTFGFVALFLASIGLYSVMAFSVSQRRREMGLRLAIGARTADVLRLVMLQGLRHTAIGLTLGIVLAFGISRVLRGLLFGVRPQDPFTLTAVLAVLFASAALACYIPALRATRADPIDALRAE
jgi:putative ABC transport system permease protein